MKQLRALYKRVGYTAASFVLALSTLTAAVPFILSENVGAVVNAVTPSTNAENKAKGWAYVEEVSKNSSSVTLKFTSTRSFNSCFEFRKDGALNAVENYNSDITDGLYEYRCLSNATQTLKIDASDYVEVRMVFGGERDERFDWTRFDTLPSPDIHSVRFSTVDATYRGIVVDQYLRNFTDATSYKATIHRADGSSVSREGESDTLSHINQGGNKALTTPFNFAGSSSNSWFGPVDAIWTSATKPVRITIEVDTVSEGLVTYSTPIDQELVQRNGLYGDLIPDYYPETTLNVSVNGDGLAGNVFTVSGSAYSPVGLNRVYVQLVHRESNTRYGGTTINLLGKGSSALWSREYNATSMNLPEGTYAAHVTVVGRNGLNSSVGWTENFTLDKTSPVFEIVTPEHNSTVAGTQRISAKITDANDIKKVLLNVGDGKGNYVWEYDKSNNKVTKDGDVFYIDIDTKTLPEGVNHVVLRATDGAGNTRYWNNNAANRQHSYSIDNTSPTAEIVAPNLANGDPVIKGISVEEGSGIKSHWFEVKAPNGTLYYVNFPNVSSSEVQFSLSEAKASDGTSIVLDDGEYRIRYVVTDKLDNRSDAPNYTNPEIHYLTLDNTAPVITGVDNTTIEQGAQFDPLAGVSASDNGTAVQVDVEGAVDTNTAGTYVLTYTATDAAGNTTSVPRTVIVLAPAVVDGGDTGTDEDDATTEDEDEENTEEETTVVFPAGFASVIGGVDLNPDLTPEADDEEEDNGEAVQGDTTENAAQVAGASDDATLFGLAWYWVALIVAAVAGGLWWLLAAIRRRSGEADA